MHPPTGGFPPSGPADRAGADASARRPRQWRDHLSIMSPTESPSAPPSPEALAAMLMAVAGHQDRVAFAGLFRHFAPRIKAWLVRGGLPDGPAEELAQETLVAVWRKAALYDPARAQASTWVYTVARNLRIDHLRRGGAISELSLDLTLFEEAHAATDDTPPRPDELVEQDRRAQQLRQAMATLPPDQRDVLHLSFYEDRPHADIAQALALPLGTVKSRIRLAVAHLRRQLGHWMP